MNWLELNSVESRSSLSYILSSSSLAGKRVYLPRTKSYYSNIHPLFYSLSGYAGKHFISISVDRHHSDIEVNIISSDTGLIDRAIDILQAKQIQPDGEEELKSEEISKLITTRGYSLLDFYLKLSLRNYLHKTGYQPETYGNRILWSKRGDNTLYSIDADVDPSTLRGYISVDIRLPSSSTLWDKIVSGDITDNELWELIDANVMVPYGNRYAYGTIHGFIARRVNETLNLNGKQLNLVDYYKRRSIPIDPNEYPIVEVEIVSPEPRGSNLLYYPPSQVRMLLPTEKPEPHTRYNKINGVLEDLVKRYNVMRIPFRKTRIKRKELVDIIRQIKLRYRDGVITHTSPLFSVQKRDAKPLHGPINIPKLLILLPKNVVTGEDNKEAVDAIRMFIRLIYRKYHLGKIGKVIVNYYEPHDNPNEQKIEFSNKLTNLLKENSPTEALLLPIINHSYLFKLAKQICSDRFFHARILEEGTFMDIMETVKELGVSGASEIEHYFSEVIKGNKKSGQLISLLSNVVFSIYVEFLLQSEIYNHRIPNKLTWALAEPADNVGKSLYMGYDVSRSTSNRNDIAVVFVLYDSYGYMLNAALRQVRGEKLTGETLESILLSLFRPLMHRPNINRLVIYKDGGIRSKGEFDDIMNTFLEIGGKMGFSQIDVVGVIKRHNIRLFEKKYRNMMANPEIGTWVKLWDINRHGVYAERALIVSSKARAGGTVKPVLLERYGKETSNKTIRDIVIEYLRLCRLDYWNPLDGMNKLPLPIYMADKLAYLALQGVQIKTP